MRPGKKIPTRKVNKPDPVPKPVPEPAPPPPKEPEKVAVRVDERLMATGDETFATGKGLFEKPAEKPGTTTEASTVPPQLLTYPFIAIFDLAANIRQYDGWKLDADERQYFDVLSRYILKRFSDVKDLDLIVAVAGIAGMMIKKGVADVEYHKEHPLPGKKPPPGQGDTNPASPTGRKGPRK